MDEKLLKALQDYVATANSGKYSSWEELNSKFPELEGVETGVLQDYVVTANSGKYSSWEEINSKFPELGKAQEVTDQGSSDTSEESGQQLSSSAEPSSPSQSEGVVYAEFDSVVQTTPLTPEEITEFGYDQDPKLATSESIKNSFANMWSHIKGLPAKTAVLLSKRAVTDNQLYRTWLQTSAALGVNSPEQVEEWAFGRLNELEEEFRPTRGFIESARSGDIGGLAAAVVDATTSVLSTFIIAAPTAGAGLVVDMTGGSIHSYNTTKAETLGITTEELRRRGLDNDLTPLITGAVGYGLERVGMKGITKAINRNLSDKFIRNATLLSLDWSKEGVTEWTQLGLETYNEAIASGASEVEAIEIAGRAMGSEEGAEMLLMGAVGGASVTGLGRGGRGILRSIDRRRAVENTQAASGLVSDANATQNPQTKEALLNSAVEKVNEVSTIEAENQDLLDAIPSETRPQVEQLVTELERTQEALQDEGLSEGSKQSLEQRAEQLSTELDDIINTVEPSVQQTEVSTEPEQGLTVREESEAQSGEYFTRDIGGDQVVYRRNDDGTATIVPDSEAQNILTQQSDVQEAEVSTEREQVNTSPQEEVRSLSQDIQDIKNSDPETYWSVDPVDPDAKGAVIRTEDGVGFVSTDGDIKGITKLPDSNKRGVADDILTLAVEAGGVKLDNFDTYLTPIYERNGFRVVSRIPFNEEFAPDGWNKETHGTPDVVAMVYDPQSRLDIEERTFLDYEEGMSYRDSFIPPTPQGSQSQGREQATTQELNTPTFFETVTDSESRKTRIEQLKQSLSDNLKADQNLGIYQDNRSRAKRDIDFLRDLTELAILSIADGTVQTAEAFRNLARGIGDFSDSVVDKAYTAAMQSVGEYQSWARPREATDARIGELLTRMQDVNLDRRPAKTKIKPTKVKELTDGGIKGKVDLTNRQALKEHIKTLNRGIKEGRKQITESRRAITNLIKEMRSEGLFKGKVRASTVRTMLNRVNAADTPAKLRSALDYLDKASSILEYDAKVEQANKLKNRAKRAAKGEKLPINLKNILTDLSRINPSHIQNIDSFNEKLSALLNGVKGIDNTTTEGLQQIVDQAKELVKNARVENLKRALLNSGMDAAYVDGLTTITALEDAVNSLPKDKRSQQDIREAREEFYNATKELLIDEQSGAQRTPLETRIIDYAISLDPKNLTDNELRSIATILSNIYSNGDFSNAGEIIRAAKRNENFNNQTLVNKIKQTVARIPRWLERLQSNALSVIVQVDSVLKNRDATSAFWTITGFGDYIRGATRYTHRVINEVNKPLERLFKKHGADLEDGYVSALFSMYVELNQFRESWDADRRKKEFEGRKQAIKESIDRMRERAARDAQFAKDYKNLLKNTEDAFEFVSKVESASEIYEMLNEGHKVAYEYIRSFYDSTFEQTREVSRVFGNLQTEDDWVNYFPRSYKYMGRNPVNSTKLDDLEQTAGSQTYAHLGLSGKETSGAAKERTVTGSGLPLSSAINFNTLDAFYESSMKVLYDIETWEARQYSVSALRDPTMVEIMGDAQAVNIFENALLQKVRNDLAGITEKDRSIADRAISYIQTLGARLGLGGVDQIAKQVIPQLSDTFARLGGISLTGNPRAARLMGLSVQATTSPKFFQLFQEMTKSEPISLRNALNTARETQSITRAQLNEMRRAFKSKALQGLNATDELIDAFSLGALRHGDLFAGRVTWMSYYLDYRTRVDGIKNIDLEQEMSNPSQAAKDFATAQSELSLNVSDPTFKSDISKTLVRGRLLTMLQPFISFTVNSKGTLLVDIVRSTRPGLSAEDRAVIRRNIAGNVSNIAVYNGITWGIRGAAVSGTAALYHYLISLASDWDEEEKELAQELVNEWKEEAVARNNANSFGYFLKDLLYGGIAEGVLEPATTAGIDLLRTAAGQEPPKRTYRPTDVYDRLGGFGIWFRTVSRAARSFHEWTLTDEEYQMRKFSIEDAWGENRIIPAEFLTKGRSETSQLAYGLTTLIHGMAISGASQQWSSAIGTRLPQVVRHLENKIDGRDRVQDLKRLEALKTIEEGGVVQELTEEQYEYRLKIRKEFLTYLYFGDEVTSLQNGEIDDKEFKKRMREAPVGNVATVKDALGAALGDEASERRVAQEADKYSEAMTLAHFPELIQTLGEEAPDKLRDKINDQISRGQAYLEWLNSGKKIERLPTRDGSNK